MTFNCPKCGEELEAEESLVGECLDCPACEQVIEVPEPGLRRRATVRAVRPTVRKQIPPKTKQSQNASNQVLGAVFLALLIGGGGIWWFYGGGFEQGVERNMEQIHEQAEKEMRRIEQDVAADAVKQYEIAKRSGSAMDAYVHAGMVAAAYLQAKDERNYQKWKGIERQEGIRAGMSPELLP